MTTYKLSIHTFLRHHYERNNMGFDSFKDYFEFSCDMVYKCEVCLQYMWKSDVTEHKCFL